MTTKELTRTEVQHLGKIGALERLWPDKPKPSRYLNLVMAAVLGGLTVGLFIAVQLGWFTTGRI